MYKISFYVPIDASEDVKNAMFDAGAGHLGHYDRCCWTTRGIGQFRPLTGSDPDRGQIGRLEVVEELKIDMMCDDEHLAAAVDGLKATHPYEEPAYAVWSLAT